MTPRQVSCRVCGRLLEAQPVYEESVVAVGGERPDHIDGVGRNFLGVCPEHGRTVAQFIGNHSTVRESEIARFFSRAARARVKRQLGPAEGRKFAAALRGRYAYTLQELTYWRALACGCPLWLAWVGPLAGGPLMELTRSAE